MPFVEGIHQYQNSTAANTQNLNNVKDTIRPLSGQAQELIPGKVFEGTVTELKNGQVTIGLSDGKTISARMESGVTLEKGQPMLFEVKSNNGEQIAIRPVTLESAQNPTLLKALEAAGLKVNDRNLSMVNQMMMEQLPIDKNSLMQMMRAAGNFPKADMQTLVQMQKLGFVITEESLNQFQNYKNGQQAILPEMQNLMEGITSLPEQVFGKESIGINAALQENIMLYEEGQNPAMAGTGQAPGQSSPATQLLGFQQQVLGILLGSQAQAASGAQMGAVQNMAAMDQVAQNQMMQNLTVANVDGTEGVIIHQDITEGNESQNQAGLNGNFMDNSLMEQDLMGENLTGSNLPKESGQIPAAEAKPVENSENLVEGSQQELQTSSEMVLTKEQQNHLTALLQEFSGARENEQLLPNGRLNTSLSAGELLQQIVAAVENSEDYTSAAMQKLFYSEEYKGLLKQAMTDQWLLTPEKLKEEGAVKELYQRLSRQMTELQQVLAQTGKEGAVLAKTAQSVQSNLEFMNQLNQVYTYVQLPLKLQNQNTHSDLYVYTNKKNLRQKEGELSALLHLDMEHLGSTDIFVKMQGSSVKTEFYLADEASYRLIAGFTGALAERLENKGYHCEVKVENRKKQQDFVQEFLEQEKPAGKLHRYSFDVKA